MDYKNKYLKYKKKYLELKKIKGGFTQAFFDGLGFPTITSLGFEWEKPNIYPFIRRADGVYEPIRLLEGGIFARRNLETLNFPDHAYYRRFGNILVQLSADHLENENRYIICLARLCDDLINSFRLRETNPDGTYTDRQLNICQNSQPEELELIFTMRQLLEPITTFAELSQSYTNFYGFIGRYFLSRFNIGVNVNGIGGFMIGYRHGYPEVNLNDQAVVATILNCAMNGQSIPCPRYRLYRGIAGINNLLILNEGPDLVTAAQQITVGLNFNESINLFKFIIPTLNEPRMQDAYDCTKSIMMLLLNNIFELNDMFLNNYLFLKIFYKVFEYKTYLSIRASDIDRSPVIEYANDIININNSAFDINIIHSNQIRRLRLFDINAYWAYLQDNHHTFQHFYLIDRYVDRVKNKWGLIVIRQSLFEKLCAHYGEHSPVVFNTLFNYFRLIYNNLALPPADVQFNRMVRNVLLSLLNDFNLNFHAIDTETIDEVNYSNGIPVNIQGQLTDNRIKKVDIEPDRVLFEIRRFRPQ
jgi:hypothetical protein